MLETVITIIALVLILGGAVGYIIRAKKRGDKCVGCPYAKQCGSGCSCSSGKDNK